MVETLISRYGLFALFAGAGLEGETVVLLGGLLAHRGLVPFGQAIAVAAAGSFLADQFFFLVGRRFREQPWVRRMSSRPAFARALAAFERRPAAFVFAFRFLYGLRTVSPLAIGTTRIPAMRFILLNAVAAAIWAALFTTLGYMFGHGIEVVLGRLRNIEHVLGIGIALAAIASGGLWLVRRQTTRRRP